MGFGIYAVGLQGMLDPNWKFPPPSEVVSEACLYGVLYLGLFLMCLVCDRCQQK